LHMAAACDTSVTLPKYVVFPPASLAQ